MKAMFLLAATMLWLHSSSAQCPFDPTVTGNTLLCPNATATLGTQQYDAYQWYSRPFSSGTSQPIPGATGPTLVVNSADVPFYVSIEATLGGCTEKSPEVLVDGWAFLPPTVLSEGDFIIGGDGQLLICPGDTVFLIALQPYTVNLQWHNFDQPIPGATDDTLVVTTPGSYWMTGAPAECPDYIAALGVQIEVDYLISPNCPPTAAPEPGHELPVLLSPNPARTSVRIAVADESPTVVALIDLAGRQVLRSVFRETTELKVSDLPRGVYVLHFSSAAGSAVRKLVLEE